MAISLPLDVVCEIPEGEETEAQEAEKGYVVPLLALTSCFFSTCAQV